MMRVLASIVRRAGRKDAWARIAAAAERGADGGRAEPRLPSSSMLRRAESTGFDEGAARPVRLRKV